MTKTNLVGHVRYDTGNIFWLEEDNGAFNRIIFPTETQAKSVPINKRLAITVSSEPDSEGCFLVVDDDPYYTELDELFPMARNNRLWIGVFHRSSADSETDQKEAEERARGASKFFKQFARHKWDIKAAGWVMDGNNCPFGPHEYCYRRMKSHFDSLDPKPDWEPTYWHVLGPPTSHACGQATLGGNKSVAYGPSCRLDTTIHEIGHNLGLMHGNLRDPLTGEDNEYNDVTTIMGSHANRAGFNAPNMIKLGLVDQEEILTVTESTQVNVIPLELPKAARRKKEWAYVRIIKDNKPYFISIRKGRGAQNILRKDWEQRLYIYEASNGANGILGNATFRTGIVLPDESNDVAIPGVVIEYLEYKDEVARVNIIFENDSTRVVEQKIESGFPSRISHIELNESHSGHWYDPYFNGQGIDLHVKDDKFVLIWFTYNQQDTRRRFYTATGTLGEGPEEFEIRTTENERGGFDSPSKRIETVIGAGQIYFLNEGKGVFNFNTQEHGRGSITLTHLTNRTPEALDSKYSGIFYNKQRDGEGFSFQFLEGDICVLDWYTYGPKNKSGGWGRPSDEIDTQRWYTGVGKKTSSNTYVFPIKLVAGLKFLEINDEPTPEELIGEATLTINKINWMDFQYNLTSNDQDGPKTGKIKLQRIF